MFHIKGNGTTLQIDIDKNTMEEFSDNDYMKFEDGIDTVIDADQMNESIIISDPDDSYNVTLDRYVSKEDINSIDSDFMPGFRLTWFHHEEDLPDIAKFNDDVTTNQFVK